MTALVEVGALIEAARTFVWDHWEGTTTTGQEHRAYGAVFLVLGGLFVAESLAGRVWWHSRLRTLILPAALVPMGIGVMAVAAVRPSPIPIHFLLGAGLALAGVFEGRHRLRQISRAQADFAIVAILALAAILVGPAHYEGTITNSFALVHWLIAGTSVALAAVRLRQHFRPTSAPLMATFGGLFIALAVEVLSVPGQHHG